MEIVARQRRHIGRGIGHLKGRTQADKAIRRQVLREIVARRL